MGYYSDDHERQSLITVQIYISHDMALDVVKSIHNLRKMMMMRKMMIP
jgi:hypothetical protein